LVALLTALCVVVAACSGGEATFKVTVNTPANGVVTVSNAAPKQGEDVTVTATPDEGYTIDSFLVDGADVEYAAGDNGSFVYVIADIQADAAVTVTFAEEDTGLKITTISLAGGMFGMAYSQTLSANVDESVTWSIESGSLPGGLSLTASTGGISGTPSAAGAFTFTVKAESEMESATKQLGITIAKAPGAGIVTMSNWTYGGTAADPVPGGTYDGDVDYEYKVQGAGDGTYTSSKPENAGSYTVRAAFAEGVNYLANFATDSFSIAKAAGAAVQGLDGEASVIREKTSLEVTGAYTANGQDLQYAVNTASAVPSSGWQSSSEFTSLTPDTNYWLFVRTAENTNYLAGFGGAISVIATKTLAAPQPLWQNGLYETGAEIEIPNGYSVTGPGGLVTVEDNIAVLDVAGKYTVTDGTTTYNFAALTTAEYGRLIAPFNGQQTDTSAIAFIDLDASGLMFGYDSAEGAWRYATAAASAISRAEVQITNASALGLKITTGYSSYAYYAMDFKFTAKPADIGFRRNDGSAFWQFTGSDVSVYDQSGEKITWAGVVPGQWYTAYLAITVTSIRPDRFMSAASAGATDFWIKNLRFENVVPIVPIELYQNGIYAVDSAVIIPAGFTVTGPAGAVAVADDIAVLDAVGKYTATDGTTTYNFAALTTAEYGRLIAPFNGQQTDTSAIELAGSFSFDYDSGEGAWRYTTAGASHMSTSQVQITNNSALGLKITTGYSSYAYYAIDLKFTAKPDDIGFRWNDASSNYWQFIGPNVIIYDQSGEETAWASVVEGQWYTAYLVINTTSIRPDRFMGATSTGATDFWIKNLRFENAVPAA